MAQRPNDREREVEREIDRGRYEVSLRAFDLVLTTPRRYWYITRRTSVNMSIHELVAEWLRLDKVKSENEWSCARVLIVLPFYIGWHDKKGNPEAGGRER
jgi:hypothetical protein